MTSLSALSSLTSLTKLKALKAIVPAETKPAATTPTPAPASPPTVPPEAPKPASPGPASVIGSRLPSERVSLGTILALQSSSPPAGAPQAPSRAEGDGAASTQASQADGQEGPSLALLTGQTKAGPTGDLGALRQTDLAGESATLQNVINRNPVLSPGYGLTSQNPQSLVRLFA